VSRIIRAKIMAAKTRPVCCGAASKYLRRQAL